MFKPKIRPIALGIIKKENYILLGKGFDSVKNETFYRALGGGIKHQEKALDAVTREFMEELGKEIKVNQELKIVENIFTYENFDGHEIVFLYECEFVNKDDYSQEVYKYLTDDNRESEAFWVDIDDIINKKVIAYPNIMIDLLK